MIDGSQNDENNLEILFSNMLADYKEKLNLDSTTFIKYLENELSDIHEK